MATTSIKEVARQAGVSLGTVSNVLNRPEVVAETHPAAGARRHHRARLRAQRLGPAAAGRPQPHRRRSWCSTWPTRSSPTWSAAPRRRSRRPARVAVVCNSGEDAARERRHLDLLEEQRVQGVLITPVDGGRDSRLAQPRPAAASRSSWSTAGRASATAARSRSTTSSADGSPATTCASRATSAVAFVGGPLSIPQVADRQQGLHRRAARRRRRPYRRHAHADRRRRSPGRGGDRRPRRRPSGRPRSSAPTTCSPSACCRR